MDLKSFNVEVESLDEGFVVGIKGGGRRRLALSLAALPGKVGLCVADMLGADMAVQEAPPAPMAVEVKPAPAATYTPAPEKKTAKVAALLERTVCAGERNAAVVELAEAFKGSGVSREMALGMVREAAALRCVPVLAVEHVDHAFRSVWGPDPKPAVQVVGLPSVGPDGIGGTPIKSPEGSPKLEKDSDEDPASSKLSEKDAERMDAVCAALAANRVVLSSDPDAPGFLSSALLDAGVFPDMSAASAFLSRAFAAGEVGRGGRTKEGYRYFLKRQIAAAAPPAPPKLEELPAAPSASTVLGSVNERVLAEVQKHKSTGADLASSIEAIKAAFPDVHGVGRLASELWSRKDLEAAPPAPPAPPAAVVTSAPEAARPSLPF